VGKASGNNLKFVVLAYLFLREPRPDDIEVTPRTSNPDVKYLDHGHNKQTCRPILTPFTQC